MEEKGNMFPLLSETTPFIFWENDKNAVEENIKVKRRYFIIKWYDKIVSATEFGYVY
jgi:hypothetical protein